MKIEKKKEEEICKLYERDKIPQYKLAEKFNVNNTIIHKILKNNNIKFITPSERGRKIKINENFFEEINNEEKAYWLGFIVADGAILRNNCLRIELSSKDHNHLEKFKNSLQSDHDIKISTKYDEKYSKFKRKYSRIQIKSKKIKNNLFTYGIIQNKSSKTFFPDIRKDLIPHFVRGYYDGDGWISKGVVGICGNEKLIIEIKKIIEKNLLIKNIKLYKVNKTGTTYQFQIYSKENRKKFLNYIYKDASVFLDRKYIKYQLLLKPTQRFKVGLDCHGIIDSFPDFFSILGELFVRNSHEVHIITGSTVNEKLIKYLTKHKMYKGINYTHIFSITDYLIEKGEKVTWEDEDNPWFDQNTWNKAKAEYCIENKIDMHFDDSKEYCKHFSTPYFLKINI